MSASRITTTPCASSAAWISSAADRSTNWWPEMPESSTPIAGVSGVDAMDMTPPLLSVGLFRHEPVDVGPQLGRRERAVFRGEREVERREDGSLEMEVEDPLGVFDRPLRQLRDALCAGHRLVEHRIVGANVVH